MGRTALTLVKDALIGKVFRRDLPPFPSNSEYNPNYAFFVTGLEPEYSHFPFCVEDLTHGCFKRMDLLRLVSCTEIPFRGLTSNEAYTLAHYEINQTAKQASEQTQPKCTENQVRNASGSDSFNLLGPKQTQHLVV